MKLYISLAFSQATMGRLSQEGVDGIPWPESQLMEIPCREPPMTVEYVACWIESRVESIYSLLVRGRSEAQAQVVSIGARGGAELPFDDEARRHLKDGDSVVAAVEVQTAAEPRPDVSERELERVRAGLRFGSSDRVVCFIGPRWVSGLVVGTAVPDGGEVLPYLVRTDPLPGLPGRTISVPMDSDRTCVQEVCFHPHTQLHLVRAAAQPVEDPARVRLRFAAGDAVAVRIRNREEDGLENWVQGTVSAVWPSIGGQATWQVGDVSGRFPEAVPYKVSLRAGGWVYCHRDHFTLIRREGWEPKTRTSGISKRMETIKAADGGMEKLDHQTERRKRVVVDDDLASDDTE